MKVISDKKKIRSVTAFGLIKCLKEILLPKCAPIAELPKEMGK